jgi:hypothetical protein
MLNVFSRPQSAVAAVSASAATAQDASSDATLVSRIAAGEKLAIRPCSLGTGRCSTAGFFGLSGMRQTPKTC